MQVKASLILCLTLSLLTVILEERLIPNRNFNVKEISQITSLPPESPTLIKPLFHPVQAKHEALQSLKAIIGFLPPSEQIALLASLDTSPVETSPSLFQLNKYIEALKNGEVNYITEQQKSLSEMLSANAKRFRAGLGCMKKVSNQFQIASPEDDIIIENINLNINEMLHASNQLNHCEMNFMKVLFERVNKKKALLTLITTANYNDQNGLNSKYFAYKEGLISGIKYDTDDVSALVNEFKNYATCHQAFNNIVHWKGLENIISIGQMKKCLDEENPNRSAGRSSGEYSNPSVNTKGGEVIGINNAEGIRTDKKTQNNYSLKYGYNFGAINVTLNDRTEQPKLPIPTDWKNKLKAFNNRMGFSMLKNKIEGILNDSIKALPFADLYHYFFETLSKKPNEYYAFLKKCPSSPFKLECADQECKTDDGNTAPSPFDTFPINQKTYKNVYGVGLSNSQYTAYNYTYILKDQYLFAYCELDQLFIYIEGTNDILGKVFDYNEYGVSLGSEMGSINQACFGVFTSGGKNDKDACRDSLNKECGSELDYRCKESGLYDFIIQNPPSDKVLPAPCLEMENTDPDCLGWIEKQFIIGSVSVRTSCFLSYSLNAQIGDSIEESQYTPVVGWSEFSTDPLYKSTVEKMTPKVNQFYVEGNLPGTFSDAGTFHIEMDRTIYIQTQQAFTARLSSLLLLLISWVLIV